MSGGDSTVEESPLEREQAAVAQQNWTDYQQRWQPVRAYYMNRTMGNLGNRRAFAEGESNVDTQGRFGTAATALGQQQSGRGALPGSSAAVMGQAQLSGQKGSASSLNRTNVDDAIERQYMSGLSDIVQIGRGQKATTDQSLTRLASLQGDVASQQAEMNAQDAAGFGQALGTGMGIGGGYGLQSMMTKMNAPQVPQAPVQQAPVQYGSYYGYNTPPGMPGQA